jgi:hypothetical protein
MEKITTFEPADSDESCELSSDVRECIQSIDLARKQITRDQTEIDHLQEETRIILQRLRLALPAA